MRPPVLTNIIPQGQLTGERHCQEPIHPGREELVVRGHDVEDTRQDASEGLKNFPGHAPERRVEFDSDFGAQGVVLGNTLKEVASQTLSLRDG